MLIKRFVYVFCFAFLFFAMWFSHGSAQQSQPQFLFSWRADTYAPPGFNGKVLPSPGSLITVSFEVVQGGKLANLSKQTIYWYVNDSLVSNVPGKQTITFSAPNFAPDVLNVRVQLPEYAGGLLSPLIKIPLVPPEAVIESAYPGGNFMGFSATVKGLPYFFNVQSPLELSFTWNVNGETPAGAEDPTNLSVGLNPDAPIGATLSIGLTVQDPSDVDGVLSASANTALRRVQ